MCEVWTTRVKRGHVVKYKIVLEYQEDKSRLDLAELEDKEYPKDLNFWGWDHFAQCPIYADESVPLPKNKFDAHSNHKRKAEFEAALAGSVLLNANLYVDLLHKIGKAMQAYMDAHLTSNKLKLYAGEVFKDHLYSDDYQYLGALGKIDEVKDVSDEQIYQQAYQGLTSWRDLPQLLILHDSLLSICREILFCHRDEVYQRLYGKLRPPELFAKRGRDEIAGDDELSEIKLSNRVGFQEFSNNNTGSTTQAHQRAIDMFTRDHIDVSDFAWDAYRREIPFVAGPSGSMAEFLMIVKMVGVDLTPEELQEYAFCCMGILVASGSHSIHEIYVIAEKLGIPYEDGRYEAVIPNSFKLTADYLHLINAYADIIQPDQLILDENNESGLSRSVSESLSITNRIASPTLSLTDSARNTPFEPMRASPDLSDNSQELKEDKSQQSSLAKKRGFQNRLKLFAPIKLQPNSENESPSEPPRSPKKP